MKHDECQVILPCNGDRIFGQVENGEMAFTIPASKISMIIEKLQATHEGGIRYPVPEFLRYSGDYPDLDNRMHDLWGSDESIADERTEV